MSFDRYDNEMVLQPNAIGKDRGAQAHATLAPEKRVELHLHTTMSSMDALTDTGAAVKRAASWGHRAIAITDHGGAQSFPDADEGCRQRAKNIKILYGCEGYYVNDVDDRIAVHGGRGLLASTRNTSPSTWKRPACRLCTTRSSRSARPS